MSFVVVKVLMVGICFIFIVRIYLRFIAIIFYTTYSDIDVINKQQNGDATVNDISYFRTNSTVNCILFYGRFPLQIVSYFMEDFYCKWYLISWKISTVNCILILWKISTANSILFYGRFLL